MAVIYYPKNQLVYIRDQQVSASNYESVLLNCSPNTVLYFDTSSLMQQVDALLIPITASWALTASLSQVLIYTVSASWASSSLSASFSDTASFALNASMGSANSASWASSSLTASVLAGQYPYTTVTTNSVWWVTCSFSNTDQFIALTTSSVYYFTASNMPDSDNTSNTTLFISHSAPYTSSLVFPSNWYWMGVAPTYISASKVAVMTLKAFGPQTVVGAYSVQY